VPEFEATYGGSYEQEMDTFAGNSAGIRPLVVWMQWGGGDDDGAFKAVTDITGVTTSGYMNLKVTLAGSVVPANATNKTIVWSLVDGGATGVSALDGGNAFTATATGTVKVRATITNGKTASTAYTKDFNINIPNAVGISVNVGGTAQITEVGDRNTASVVSIANGYQFTTTANNYGNCYTYFKVNLGAKTVGDIATVKATLFSGGNDPNNKPYLVAVSSLVPTASQSNTGSNNWGSSATPIELTFNKNFGSNTSLTGDVYIILYGWLGGGTIVTITNVAIAFNP
jgi:hypothetical protein